MGKILDARGEEALDVLSALLDPVGEIAGDAEISAMMQPGGNATLLDLARAMLKNHKTAVIEIMAVDDGKTVEEERGILTAFTIPGRLMKLLSVPAVRDLLFGSGEAVTPATGSSAGSSSGNG
jgi:hypothetical protein